MCYINFQLYKRFICTAIFFIAVQISFAQSYTHSPNDSIVANATYDDFNVYNIIQNHTTNDTLIFKWKKYFVNLPNTWEASICDVGHCYSTIVDSSTTDPIVTGDNGLISLHLNPHWQAGTGIVQVLFWEQKTPSQIDTLSWIITASGIIGINDIDKKNAIIIYPNPANEIINIITPFENGFEYMIIDNAGKKICNNVAKSKTVFVQTSLYPTGKYVLKIVSSKTISNISFIIKN